MREDERRRLIDASLRVATELERQAQQQREAAQRLMLQSKDPQHD